MTEEEPLPEDPLQEVFYEETETEATPQKDPRVAPFGLSRFLSWLLVLGKVCSVLVFALLATALLLLLHPPKALQTYLFKEGQRILYHETGLALTTDDFTLKNLLWPQGQVHLKNLRLYGHPMAKDPVLWVPEAELEFDLWAYLLQRESINTLRIKGPRIDLKRDRNGLLTLRPLMRSKKKSESSGAHPYLPRFVLLLDQGRVAFEDQDPRHPFKTHLNVPQLSVTLLDQSHLSFLAQAKGDLLKMKLSGKLDIWDGKGNAHLDLDSDNLKGIAAYANRVKGVTLYQGEIHAQANAAWNDYKVQGLVFKGALEAHDFKIQPPFYKKPVVLNTLLNFDQNALSIQKLNVLTARSKVLLKGEVKHFLQPEKIQLQSTVHSSPLSLAEIAQDIDHPAIKSFAALKPQGQVYADLNVTGPLKALKISGQARLPQGVVKGIHLNQAQTHVTLYQDKLKIHRLSSQVFNGRLQATGELDLKRQSMFSQARFQRLSLPAITRDLKINIPRDYHPSGLVNGQAQLSGPFKFIKVTGDLNSSEIRFENNLKIGGLQRVTGRYSYSPLEVKVQLKTQAQKFGPLDAHLNLTRLDQIQAQVQMASLPVSAVNPWLKSAHFKRGKLTGKLALKGSLKRMKRNWQAFGATAHLGVQDLSVKYALGSDKNTQQDLDDFNLAMGWQNGMIQVEQINLKENDSVLRGHGKINLPRLLGKAKLKAVQMNLNGKVHLVDFPVLRHYDVDTGEVEVALKTTTLANGNLKIDLKTEGHSISAKGLDIDSVQVDSEYRDDLLTVREVTLAQGGQSLNVQGQIDLKTKDPKVRLTAHSEELSLKTILALLPPSMTARFKTDEIKPTLRPKGPAQQFFIPELKNSRPLQVAVKNIQSPNETDFELPLNEFMAQQLVSQIKPSAIYREIPPPPPSLARVWKSLDGTISLDMKMEGSLKEPEVTLQTLVQDFKVQDVTVPETYLKANYSKNKIKVDHFHLLEAKGGVIQAQGEITSGKKSALEFSGQNVRLDLARPWYQSKISRLDGKMNFFGVVKGQLSSPEVTAEIQVKDLLVKDYFFDMVEALSDYKQGYLKDLTVKAKYGNQEISAFGNVPVSREKPVDLSVKLENESFGLLNLFTESIRWQEGGGSALLHLGGTLKNPELQGDLEIDKAKIYVPSLKDSLTDLSGKVKMVPSKERGGEPPIMDLKYLKGRLGGGDVSVKGYIELLDLIPSFLRLSTEMNNIEIKYRRPGFLDSKVPVRQAKIDIRGLPKQPTLRGQVLLGEKGSLYMPFIRSEKKESGQRIVSDSEANAPSRFFFDRLKVYIPDTFNLGSPIFDIDITSKEGIKLKHRAGQVTFTGNVEAKRGELFLLNNILSVEKLDVSFSQANSIGVQRLNPDLTILTSFPMTQGDETYDVQAKMKGTLEDLRTNSMVFKFNNNAGDEDRVPLTDTEILAHLSGKAAFDEISQGNLTQAAGRFSDVFLRNLFNPLTSTLSQLLGLDDLSLGLKGISDQGETIFNFNIRSRPFFFLQEQLKLSENKSFTFLEQIRVGAKGETSMGGNAKYELSTQYKLGAHWNLDLTLGNLNEGQGFVMNNQLCNPNSTSTVSCNPWSVKIDSSYDLDLLMLAAEQSLSQMVDSVNQALWHKDKSVAGPKKSVQKSKIP